MTTAENDPNIISSGDDFEDFKDGANSLGEFILNKLKLGGNSVAFINGKTDEKLTFSEIEEKSVQVARCLRNYGIEKDDKVAIIAENRFEYVFISLGVIYLGAVIVPISHMYKKLEYEHALKLVKPKLVFVSKEPCTTVVEVTKECNIPCDIVSLDSDAPTIFSIPFKTFMKNQGSVKDIVPDKVDLCDQVATVLFSSGTTGLPKGVQLTHANLMILNKTSAQMREIIKMTYEQTMVSITIAPWSHALGFVTAFLTACSGESKIIVMDQFIDDLFLSCIEKYKVNTITVVPPILLFLVKTPLFDNYNLTSLKEIFCGAALITKELEDAVKQRFNDQVSIRQIYGMTETSTGVTATFGVAPPGSVGTIFRGMQGKVVDENGKSLGPNQKGELCFKGPRVMKGYIGNEEATRETIDKDGWLHTGDIGYYDEDFVFYIVDRKKELIKFNAFQVPPAEIELLLQNHPKISDAGVIGIPDQRTGEKAFAFVVKRPGQQLTEEEVVEFVKRQLSRPKQLHGGVRFIEQIPRNSSGKVLRKDLKVMYEESTLKPKL